MRGEQIYIDRKQKRWEGNARHHIVTEGETVASVAQSYALREKSLRKLNRLKAGAALAHRPDTAHPVDGYLSGTDPTHAARAGNGSRGSPEGPGANGATHNLRQVRKDFNFQRLNF